MSIFTCAHPAFSHTYSRVYIRTTSLILGSTSLILRLGDRGAAKTMHYLLTSIHTRYTYALPSIRLGERGAAKTEEGARKQQREHFFKKSIALRFEFEFVPYARVLWKLQCVAVSCSVLRRVTTCCSVLQFELEHYAKVLLKLQRVAACCSVLQCGAVWCSVLRCSAIWCNGMQCVAVRCNALQCVVLCCSVLQCVAIGRLKLQVIFGKKTLQFMALLQKGILLILATL